MENLEGKQLDSRNPGAQLYGLEFAEVLGVPPSSEFLAEGSAVAVYRAERIA